MSNPIRRGEVGSQVNSWQPSTNAVTPNGFTSSIAPYGLQLQQTKNAGDTSVTIPAGITFVYAICVGGGGGGGNVTSSYGGGGGGMAWGWTLATSSCVIGAGAAANTANTGYTQYGHIIAGYGGTGNLQAGLLGGGGGGANATTNGGGTNYWGIPGGLGGQSTSTVKGIGGGGAGSSISYGISASSGISGGGGGGSGGAGLIGGGGTTGLGGKGVNILTGATYTPTGSGGAGIAGNGSGATGGLGGGGGGGGGSGGAGILYLFY